MGDDEDPREAALRAALRAEAARHEPDVDLVMRRVARGRREPPAARARRRAVRPVVAALATAATVVGIAGAGTVLAGRDRTGTTAPVAVSGGTSAPSGVVDGSTPRSPGDGASGATSGTTGPAGEGSGDGGTGTAGGDVPGTTSSEATVPAAGGLHLTVEAAPGAVTVPGSVAAADWLVVGSRQDGRAIAAKSGEGRIGDPVVDGTAAVEEGPFSLSWTGGTPEQDHDGATTWWATSAGATVTVPVTVEPGETVQLRAGGSGGTAVLTATLGGLTGSVELPEGGDLVQVPVPASAEGGTLELVLSPGTGRVALSVVEVF